MLEGEGRREEIASMPGVYRLSLDLLLQEVQGLIECGIRAVDLFVVCPSHKKDRMGSEAVRPGNLLEQGVSN